MASCSRLEEAAMSDAPETAGAGMNWRKALRSQGNGGACVEVAKIRGGVAIRDSKNPDEALIVVGREQWRRLVDFVRCY
jgi:hypothetical protein